MKKTKRRPTTYDLGQHQLICDALKVSSDPEASGLTAYEAVCATMFKLELAEAAIRQTLRDNKHLADGDTCLLLPLKQIAHTIAQPNEKFELLPCYGTEAKPSHEHTQRPNSGPARPL